MGNHKDLKISAVPKLYTNDLEAIAENIGISVSALVKPHIKGIIESYPPEYRRVRKD